MKKLIFTCLVLFSMSMGGLNAANATLDQLTAANGTGLSNIPASYPVSVTDAVIFGSDASSQVGNANVNNYDYIYFEVENFRAERAIRVFFWDPNQNKRIDYFLKPVTDKETADYSQQTTVSKAGTYCVKIPDGARLQGAKAPWTASGTTEAYFQFSQIYLTERATPFVELVPYTLEFNSGRAIIPISESHVRTTGNVTINYATGEVTNTGSGSLIIYLNNEDLVGASLYHVDFTGTNLEPILQITDAVNGEVGGIYNSRFNWNIANDASRREKVGAVTAFKYDFSNTGSMTFTSIYIDANEILPGTTIKNLADLPYGRWGAPANTVSQYIDVDSYKTNNIDGSAHNDVLFGRQNNGDANYYVDLTNCSKIIFTGFSNNGQIRLFYNWDGTDANKPIETISDFPQTAGTYVFDIDAFKKAKGITFFHLIGIKSAWADVTLSSVTVDEYTNVISGSGINRTKAYLTNPYLTAIDATGLTKAMELPVANPNCIIKANAGMVTNTQNVMVNDVIENLVITDGYPFAAPAGATATAATYSRSMGNQFGTICLPYAVSSTADVKYYTINELRSDEALSLTAVTDLPAGTPAVVEKVSGTGITAAGAGALAGVAATTGDLRLIGTFVPTTISATDYDAIYAISNNEFVKATKTITLKPFRAFFAADSSAAKLRLVVDGEATAIDGLTDSAARVEGIYSVDGARRPSLQRGLNVVKMSNGVTTKVYVK